MVKLTKNEQEVLTYLINGGKCHYMRSIGNFQPNAYWYRADNHKKCTRQIEGLAKKGHLKFKYPNPYNNETIISEVIQ